MIKRKGGTENGRKGTEDSARFPSPAGIRGCRRRAGALRAATKDAGACRLRRRSVTAGETAWILPGAGFPARVPPRRAPQFRGEVVAGATGAVRCAASDAPSHPGAPRDGEEPPGRHFARCFLKKPRAERFRQKKCRGAAPPPHRARFAGSTALRRGGGTKILPDTGAKRIAGACPDPGKPRRSYAATGVPTDAPFPRPAPENALFLPPSHAQATAARQQSARQRRKNQ